MYTERVFFHTPRNDDVASISSSRLREMQDHTAGLNHFMDAVSFEKNEDYERPTEDTLKRYGVANEAGFFETLSKHLDSSKKLVSAAQPRTDAEQNESWKLQNLEYCEKLHEFRQRLHTYKSALNRESLYAHSIQVAEAEGKTKNLPVKDVGRTVEKTIKLIDQHLGNIQLELDENPMHNSLFEEIDRQVKTTYQNQIDKYEEEIQSLRLGKSSEDDGKNKKWPTKKIIGVTALGLSAASALALMVYLYETHQDKKQPLVYQYQHPQRQMSPTNYAQPQSLSGYMNYGVQPAMNPAALGYNPSTMSGASLGGAFNPNPLYSYPVV